MVLVTRCHLQCSILPGRALVPAQNPTPLLRVRHVESLPDNFEQQYPDVQIHYTPYGLWQKTLVYRYQSAGNEKGPE